MKELKLQAPYGNFSYLFGLKLTPPLGIIFDQEGTDFALIYRTAITVTASRKLGQIFRRAL